MRVSLGRVFSRAHLFPSACYAGYGGRGICALVLSPSRGIWQLKSPHPREFAIQGKTNASARGSAREGGGGGCAQLESTDAFYQKLNLWQGSIWWKHVRRKQFSKWDFVQVLLLNAETQLQKLKMQVSFCHPSQRNKRIKMWESHPNDYWVFCKVSDLLSLTPWSSHGPPLSKIAAGSNFLPWGRSGWQIRDFKI